MRAEHFLRSQVGIRSESHCVLGQLNKILEISDSEAGLKWRSRGEEGECGDDDVELMVINNIYLYLMTVSILQDVIKIILYRFHWKFNCSCVLNRLRNKSGSKFCKNSSVINKIVQKILWLGFCGHGVFLQK